MFFKPRQDNLTGYILNKACCITDKCDNSENTFSMKIDLDLYVSGKFTNKGTTRQYRQGNLVFKVGNHALV